MFRHRFYEVLESMSHFTATLQNMTPARDPKQLFLRATCMRNLFVFFIVRCSRCLYIYMNLCVLTCFLRIRSVQKVIHNLTQLSGRGFPHIFYMRSILSQFYVSLVLQKGSPAENACFTTPASPSERPYHMP